MRSIFDFTNENSAKFTEQEVSNVCEKELTDLAG